MPRRTAWRGIPVERHVKMLDVNDVRLPVVEDTARKMLDGRVRVTRFKRFAGLERVVDAENLDRPCSTLVNREFASVWIGVASEDGNLTAGCRHCGSEVPGVDLGPAIGRGRKAVNDLKNPHC